MKYQKCSFCFEVMETIQCIFPDKILKGLNKIVVNKMMKKIAN